MISKNKVATITILICTLLASTPLMVAAQTNRAPPATTNMVNLAEKAAARVQNLIDMVQSNQNAIEKIEEAGLLSDFEDNITLFETNGANKLADAKTALANADYQTAEENAIQALQIYRDIYCALHLILESVDLERGELVERQGLLVAITREQQRIQRLKDLLPDDVTQETLDKLQEAQDKLAEARQLLLDGEAQQATIKFVEAKKILAEVHQYLREQGRETNTWRIRDYVEGLKNRIQQRLREARQRGFDIQDLLQSQGYQTENQLIAALQSRIQNADGENFVENMRNIRAVGEMVTQFEQAINQRLNQAQNGLGRGGK